MTDDPFKFDIRVRERMRRRGALSPGELEKHLHALPDVAEAAHYLEVADPVSEGTGPGANGRSSGGNPA